MTPGEYCEALLRPIKALHIYFHFSLTATSCDICSCVLINV